MKLDDIEPTLREVLAEMLSVQTRAENGESAAVLVAEVDSLMQYVNEAIDGWFARQKQLEAAYRAFKA